MRILLFTTIVILSLSGCTERNSAKPLKIAAIQKYKIELTDELIKSSGGFYPGVGSGIVFHKTLDNDDLEFFAISDRGPAFSLKEDSQYRSTKR